MKINGVRPFKLLLFINIIYKKIEDKILNIKNYESLKGLTP